MKTIDILRFIAPDVRRLMEERKLLRATVLRDMEIYEGYIALRQGGKRAMDAYQTLADKFCLDTDGIRRIIAKMMK